MDKVIRAQVVRVGFESDELAVLADGGVGADAVAEHIAIGGANQQQFLRKIWVWSPPSAPKMVDAD